MQRSAGGSVADDGRTARESQFFSAPECFSHRDCWSRASERARRKRQTQSLFAPEIISQAGGECRRVSVCCREARTIFSQFPMFGTKGCAGFFFVIFRSGETRVWVGESQSAAGGKIQLRRRFYFRGGGARALCSVAKVKAQTMRIALNGRRRRISLSSHIALYLLMEVKGLIFYFVVNAESANRAHADLEFNSSTEQYTHSKVCACTICMIF